jgi:hypothetical protein
MRKAIMIAATNEKASLLQKILNVRSSNLLWYLPLNDTSGTVAKNAAPYRSGINLECVQNGGFETLTISPNTFYGWTDNPNGGSINVETSSVHSGTRALKFISATSYPFMNHDIVDPVYDNITYIVNLYTHGDGTNALTFRVKRSDAGAWLVNESTGITDANAYHLYTKSFTTPVGYPGFSLQLAAPAVDGATIYVDDVSVAYAVAPQRDMFDSAYSGAVTLNQPGVSGRSILLDGSTGIVKMNRPAFANNVPIAGSYVIYANPDSSMLSDQHFLLKFKTNPNSNSDSTYLDCFTYNSGLAGAQFKDIGNSDNTLHGNAVSANSWFSIGCTWSVANGIRLYQDGAVVATAPTVTGGGFKPFYYTGLLIGANYAGLGYNWKGNVQHCAMWDTELSAAEMLRVGKY